MGYRIIMQIEHILQKCSFKFKHILGYLNIGKLGAEVLRPLFSLCISFGKHFN